MSADNWTKCPQCVKDADAKKFELRAKAAAAYGIVTPEKWQQMTNEAEASGELEDTLREDYELGIWNNRETGLPQFYASYSGACTACKFSYRFKKEETLTLT